MSAFERAIDSRSLRYLGTDRGEVRCLALQLCGLPARIRFIKKSHETFFCAIRAFTQLELMRAEDLIDNRYEVRRNLSLQAAREFILSHLKKKVGINAHVHAFANTQVL